MQACKQAVGAIEDNGFSMPSGMAAQLREPLLAGRELLHVDVVDEMFHGDGVGVQLGLSVHAIPSDNGYMLVADVLEYLDGCCRRSGTRAQMAA